MDWSRWSDENNLPGWFNLEEGKYLYQVVFDLPANSNIVEIGCYRGRSTVVMLQACADSEADKPGKRVESIDYFSGMGSIDDTKAPSAEQQFAAKAEFLNNIAGWNLARFFGGVTVARSEDWFSAKSPDDHQYSMFFIDGYHPIIAQDMLNAWNLLKPGGILVCHDYDISAGGPVVDAINSAGLRGGHCGVGGTSLWVGTKYNVRGF